MTTRSATAVMPAIVFSPPPPQISLSSLELDGYLTAIIVTPQAAPIGLSAWIARLIGDAALLADMDELEAAVGHVMIRYRTLLQEIDRSVARLETDRVADYRPSFLSGGRKPTSEAVRTWARGFWKGMELAPASWSKLAQDDGMQILIAPFLRYFDVDGLEHRETDERLDEDAALIPRMILLLRKLARILQATPPPRRQNKIGRNDPCPCGSGHKYKRCCGST